MKIYCHGGKVSFFRQPIQAIIQFGTDSPYFHVDLEYRDGLIIGALFGKGITVQHPNNLKPKKGQYIDVYECQEFINSECYFKFLDSKIGQKYDKWGVIYLAWLKIRRKREAANRWQKDRDYFCSELGAAAFRAGGALLSDNPRNATASPADLARSESFKKVGTLTLDGLEG